MKAYVEHNKSKHLVSSSIHSGLAIKIPAIFIRRYKLGWQWWRPRAKWSTWATEFTILASLPWKTEEERVGHLSITVRRDAGDSSSKSMVKVIGIGSPTVSSEEVPITNLLKGITAVIHDTASLGTVFVRHCGYIATVKVVGDIKKSKFISQNISIDDGVNALNINSLRALFLNSRDVKLPGCPSPLSEIGNLESSRCVVRQVIKEILTNLEKSEASGKPIRWELGSCWVQHLQKQETPGTDLHLKQKEKGK
ncbi:hypothetical protein L2E82_01718 [Cichorium intybus]|uniref:Uncharacterized protein n=1 Tax=Cichorium intybus TaxID=13427 RepID=A0ACB9H0R1_CICIN|nr:hypothetical protein L2E82_01718 [Cichorium intybus]